MFSVHVRQTVRHPVISESEFHDPGIVAEVVQQDTGRPGRSDVAIPRPPAPDLTGTSVTMDV